MPGTWPFAHEMKSPRRQASQVKSQPPNHPTPTRSPMLPPATPSPRASTAPATSWPGARGKSLPIAPNTVSESEWQTPQAWTLTRTWPGPGSGTSTSTTSNCPLASVTRAIFIVPMAATLPPRDIAARCVPLESRRRPGCVLAGRDRLEGLRAGAIDERDGVGEHVVLGVRERHPERPRHPARLLRRAGDLVIDRARAAAHELVDGDAALGDEPVGTDRPRAGGVEQLEGEGASAGAAHLEAGHRHERGFVI